jgi:hypothetical protein
MIKYAKCEPEGLKTRLPRITWIKQEWTPSAMGDILHSLNRKRKEILDNDLCPDMLQRNIRLKQKRVECISPTDTSNTRDGDNGGDIQDRNAQNICVGKKSNPAEQRHWKGPALGTRGLEAVN